MAAVKAWFIANAGSERFNDLLTIFDMRIKLEKKTLKLENPEYFEGDLFIKKFVAAMSHVLIAKQLDHDGAERDGNQIPINFKPDDVSIEALMAASTNVVDLFIRTTRASAELSDYPENNLRWDTIYLHSVSAFRSALVYLELRHSIKHGDPGRMFATFPFLSAIFRATNRVNYAPEILETQYRYRHTWTPQLCVAMLGHCIVNTTGRMDGWEGIDMYQEHDVLTHKQDWPLSEQRKSNNHLHQEISCIIHTIRKLKRGFFQEWAISGLRDVGAKASIHQEAYSLVPAFWKNNVTEWIDDRTSSVYEAYEGDIDQRRKMNGEPSSSVKGIVTDPMAKGYRMLMGSHLQSSVHSFVNDRWKRITPTWSKPLAKDPQAPSAQAAAAAVAAHTVDGEPQPEALQVVLAPEGAMEDVIMQNVAENPPPHNAPP
jgi:hypothetical protein